MSLPLCGVSERAGTVAPGREIVLPNGRQSPHLTGESRYHYAINSHFARRISDFSGNQPHFSGKRVPTRENRRRFGVWRRAEDGRSPRKRVKKSLASGTGRSMGRQIPLWECFPVFEGSLVPLLRGSLPFAGKSAPLLGNRRRFGHGERPLEGRVCPAKGRRRWLLGSEALRVRRLLCRKSYPNCNIFFLNCVLYSVFGAISIIPGLGETRKSENPAPRTGGCRPTLQGSL